MSNVINTNEKMIEAINAVLRDKKDAREFDS